MYAVIETGGKQYKVRSGDLLSVEKLPVQAGETIKLEKVLFIQGGNQSTVGDPLIPGAFVTGEVMAHGRNRKIIVFKKKRRKNYRRTQGHRQANTQIRITGIETGAA